MFDHHQLKKLKPLDNPFSSTATSANTILNSHSIYNDRSRIILSQQSQNEEEEQKYRWKQKQQVVRHSQQQDNRVTFGQNNADRIVNNRQIYEKNDEQPEDQSQTLQLLEGMKQIGGNFSGIKNNIPQLINARTINNPNVDNAESQELKGSLIDQIKCQNFYHSQVFQQEPEQMKTERKHVRRRTKIFNQNRQIPNSQVNPHHRSSHIIINKVQKRQQPHHQQQYYYCPHAQCMLKSLDIIDKLTDHSPFMHNNNNIESKILSLEASTLEVSKELQLFTINLELQRLYQSQIAKNQIKQYKIQLERLSLQLREIQQKYFQKKGTLNERSILKNINDKIQRNTKIITYLQIVQARFSMWKVRLNVLMKKIEGLAKMKQSQQLTKIKELVQSRSELKESKIYCDQDQNYGFIRNFNQFIDKQAYLMDKAIECVKIDFMKNKNI